MYTGKAVVNITSHIQIHLGFNSTSCWMCVYEVCTQYYICTYLRNFVTISLEQQWDPWEVFPLKELLCQIPEACLWNGFSRSSPYKQKGFQVSRLPTDIAVPDSSRLWLTKALATLRGKKCLKLADVTFLFWSGKSSSSISGSARPLVDKSVNGRSWVNSLRAQLWPPTGSWPWGQARQHSPQAQT